MTRSTTATRGIKIYRADQAPSLAEDGMMTPGELSESVYTTYDLSVFDAGSEVKVLFKGQGPEGLSLVHLRFGAGYPLPRHSHSVDCLYYVTAGEAVMGQRVIKAGDGFYVKAGQPYAYHAGPDGVEVLEFRAATSFDITIFDQTVARWKPMVEAARAHHDRWVSAGTRGE